MSVAPSWETVEPALSGDGVREAPGWLIELARRLLQQFRHASLPPPAEMRCVAAGIEIAWEIDGRRIMLTVGKERTVDLCVWAGERLTSFGSVHADSALHAYARFLGPASAAAGNDHTAGDDAESAS